jgi:hypothetical protein
MPDTIKVIHNFGEISVRFEALDPKDQPEYWIGDNAVVEGEKDEVVKWLKPFDGVAIGCGSPQLERFTIRSIKKDM